ncbi:MULTISPECIES: hypothetical protein [Methanobacterium]|jgi:hypothetical protein|nr:MULTISPECIES: hypothetical protein [Methanobacterium]
MDYMCPVYLLIGYINLLQFAILAVAGIPMAQIDVLAAHKMPENS